MTLELVVLRDAGDVPCPADTQFRAWSEAALAANGQGGALGLTIRIVDAVESQRLNRAYRHKDGPTNVLSFPAELPKGLLEQLPARPLGDLAICAALVASEAAEQGKSETHHWAHLVVHGVLHLLGHDHLEEDQAVRMEAQEREILERLGIPDPYHAD